MSEEQVLPLSREQITPELADLARKAVASYTEGLGHSLSATAGIYAVYTIIRERQLESALASLAQSEAERERLQGAESKRNEEIDRAIKRGFGCDVDSLPTPHERRFSGAVLEAANGDTEYISKWLRLFINARDEATESLRAELARERERHQELRQVVKQYRDSSMDHKELCWKSYGYGKTDIRCDLCVKADALLAPKADPAPVATGEDIQ